MLVIILALLTSCVSAPVIYETEITKFPVGNIPTVNTKQQESNNNTALFEDVNGCKTYICVVVSRTRVVMTWFKIGPPFIPLIWLLIRSLVDLTKNVKEELDLLLICAFCMLVPLKKLHNLWKKINFPSQIPRKVS
jgi:hypothetical protein